MGQEKVLLLSSIFILFLGLQTQMQQMFVLLYLYGLLYEQSLVTNRDAKVEELLAWACDISSGCKALKRGGGGYNEPLRRTFSRGVWGHAPPEIFENLSL